MQWVISDSSTLIHLAKIDRLNLLQNLYERITVPPAVWHEVVEQGAGRPGVVELIEARQNGWVQMVEPGDKPLVRLLERDLDEGEAEVIALAVEKKAELILLDETEARRITDLYSITKSGVIGVLIKAKQKGLISNLREDLERLREDAGFWIEDKLYKQALKAVGETDN